MNISQIMTKDVVTVREDALITEIASMITHQRIHAVPVVDNENKVIGIITESDFFSKNSPALVYLPTLLDFVRFGKLHEISDQVETKEAVHNALAESIMSTPCVTVHEGDDVYKFIRIAQERGFNSVPVVDSEDKLVGIITVMDILKLL